MDLRKVDVARLRSYERNPRRGDVALIAESLEVNGQYRPIVVNKGTHTGRKMEVLCGNHTLEAAKRLGWDVIRAVVVDVTDEAAARIVVADNRTADLGQYDTAALVDLLESLDDLTGTGYTQDDLDDFTDDLLLPDPIKAVTDFGEGDQNAVIKGTTFSFRTTSQRITEPEAERFYSLYDRYVADNGSHEGFVRWLCERVADTQVLRDAEGLRPRVAKDSSQFNKNERPRVFEAARRR